MIKYIFIISLCINLISCSGNGDKAIKHIEFNEVVKGNPDIEFVCELNENISLLDQIIYQLRLISDSTFLITTGKQVFLYNIDGEQLTNIGMYGRGPGEYLRAIKSYVSDNYIYILCSDVGQMLVYDRDGNYVKKYDSPLPHSEFIVEEDSIVTFYRASMQDNILIKRFILDSGEMIASYDHYTNADHPLFAMNDTGAFNQIGNEILYLSPSKLELNSIIDGEHKTLLKIINSEFDVHLNVNLDQVNNWQFMKNNSVVRGVHAYGDRIYILAETGKMVYVDGCVQSSDTRQLNLFEIDRTNLEPIKQRVYTNREEFMYSNFFYKNYIYYITDSENLGRRKLCRVKL